MSKQQSTAFKAGTNNSEARDTWVRAKLAALPKGLKLLDAGAGEQRYKKECAHLEYVSQDFCQYEGVGNELGLQTGSWDVSKIDIVCDITQIPLESGSFDCVLCTEVFEHVPDPVSALKELCRLVKKGGCIILTAPITSLTHFAPYHFATGFNRYWYEVHLPSFGFTIEEISQNGGYYDFLAQELRRLRSVMKGSSKEKMNLIQRAALSILLKLLNKLSSNDEGRTHMLTGHGFHVLAKKN